MAINTAPTFTTKGSGDGIVVTDISLVDGVSSTDRLSGIAVQPDGKIILAGFSKSYGGSHDFALARYNSDGSLDNTFSDEGKLTTDFGGSDSAFAVTTQSDGKILLAGQSGQADFALARYNRDGSLDMSFSDDGKLTTDFGGGEIALAVTMQSAGKILLAGGNGNDFALVRYNSDGSLDKTFSSDGKLTTDFGGSENASVCYVQADGKILLSGISQVGRDKSFSLARYNSDGTLDKTFNSDGRLTTNVITPAFNGLFTENTVAVQADGKILLAGGIGDFALARYNSDGTLDNTFGIDGVINTDISGGVDYGQSVTLQADGKILASGTSLNSGVDSSFLVRYNRDGSLDTSFGDGGKLAAIAGSITIQADGKILLAGGGSDFTLARLNSDGSIDTSFDAITTLNGSAQYLEKSTAVILDADVVIMDKELSTSGNYAGATLKLERNGGADSDDLFSGVGIVAGKASGTVVINNITIGTYAYKSGGLLITFNSAATQTLVNKAMQKIAYSNNTDYPEASLQIDWLFNDGNTGKQGTGGAMYVTGYSSVNITSDEDTIYGTGGNDTLYGGAGDDTIEGHSGNDILDGGVGDDNMYGHSGNDTLDGGTGDDTMEGSEGNDIYIVDSAGDVIYEDPSVEGWDTAKASVSYTLSSHNGVETLMLTGTKAINATGNDEYNILIGNSAANVLTGNGGGDILNGGAGNDTMVGGDDSDTYIVDSLLDVLIETDSTIAGYYGDTVKASVSFTLAQNFENLTLMGSKAINATGNSLDNMLVGNTAANVLDGGLGSDSMSGGAGNDTYVVDAKYVLIDFTGAFSGDLVQETSTLATEIDTVKSSITYTLGKNLENLILTGSKVINATGNAVNNALTGNNAANVLDGGVGNDTMSGGAGNDTYIVNVAGDVIKETSTLVTEVDTVKSAIAYTLGNNLENLILTGTASIKGVGNALDNTLTGTNGNNQLEGNAGNDVLVAGNGEDILVGGAGTDTFMITTKLGRDKISDFVTGVEDVIFSAGAVNVGDGDAVLEGKLVRSASGGFNASNELVIFTKNIAGAITNINAASAIGSATEKLAIGYNKLFVVDNGVESNVYLFTSADGNASVSSSELKLLVTMYDVNNSAINDYFLQA